MVHEVQLLICKNKVPKTIMLGTRLKCLLRRLVIICATERNGTQRSATKFQGGSLIAGYTTLNTKLLHKKRKST